MQRVIPMYITTVVFHSDVNEISEQQTQTCLQMFEYFRAAYILRNDSHPPNSGGIISRHLWSVSKQGKNESTIIFRTCHDPIADKFHVTLLTMHAPL